MAVDPLTDLNALHPELDELMQAELEISAVRTSTRPLPKDTS